MEVTSILLMPLHLGYVNHIVIYSLWFNMGRGPLWGEMTQWVCTDRVMHFLVMALPVEQQLSLTWVKRTNLSLPCYWGLRCDSFGIRVVQLESYHLGSLWKVLPQEAAILNVSHEDGHDCNMNYNTATPFLIRIFIWVWIWVCLGLPDTHTFPPVT